MSFLFARNKPKTPQEVVYALNELILRQDAASDQKEIYKLIYQAKLIAYGDQDNDPDPDQISALAKEIYSTDLLVHVIGNLEALDFDSRRDISMIFTFLLRRQIGARSPTSDYLLTRSTVFVMLISAAGTTDTHSAACVMLRECTKHEALVEYIVNLPDFWAFFDIFREQPFEVSTDCFVTFSEFLRAYPDITARFLKSNLNDFMRNINATIMAPNYVMRRQTLRLQAQLIRHRRNNEYMKEYVRNTENLKMVMRLMRDKSKNIHYETFQIFKVFVANPDKPRGIYDILVRNKVKLLELLERLKELDRKEDDVFKSERRYVIDRIRELPDINAAATRLALDHTPGVSPLHTPSASPTRSRAPTGESYQQPSAPPSPSRAQVPIGLSLGQAPPVLGHQVPHLEPPVL